MIIFAQLIVPPGENLLQATQGQFIGTWTRGGSVGKAEIIERQRSFEKLGVIAGKIGKLITLPKRIQNRIKNNGFGKTIKYCLNKITKV